MSTKPWRVFARHDLIEEVAGSEPRLAELFRAPTLSCAVYRLPAGARDMQAPHLEDEVYFVLEGRARLSVDGQERQISTGDVLFVRATLEHSFFDIEEDMTLVAVFGIVKPVKPIEEALPQARQKTKT